MRSISVRCVALKDCAWAGAAGSASRTANSAATHGPTHGRRSNVIIVVLLSSAAQGALRGLEAGEVVGFDPARRADGKAHLGAGGNLARGLEVAADESRLRGGEIGAGEVVFLAIGHRELHEAFGRFRLTHH